MKQTFLNSLVGMTVKSAEAAVAAEGLSSWTMPEGSVYILLAIGKTVQIFHDENDIVISAQSAGDEVEAS